MKTLFLALLLAAAAIAQPVISGPNPQVRKGSGTAHTIGTVGTFTGSGAPGSVAGSQQGDLYLDTTGQNTYQCYASPGPCNAVATNNWVQVSSTNGTFTNLTVGTLAVTSPLYNSGAFTGGIIVGGDIGVTGGITGAGGLTIAGAGAINGLQINSSSGQALHIPNGGITIDGTGSLVAGGVNVQQTTTQYLNVASTATFGGTITLGAGDLNVSGNVNLTGGSFTASGGGLSVTGNVVTSAGQVRVAGAHVVLDPSGSVSWANGAANLDSSGNVNGVSAGFSGTVTAPNFYSNTGNFKISGDNIIMNRSTSTIVQQHQWLVGNNANAVGSFILGSDNTGQFTISGGTGSALAKLFQINPASGDTSWLNGSTTEVELNGSNGLLIWGAGNGALQTGGSVDVRAGGAFRLGRTNSASVSQFQICVGGNPVANTCDPTQSGGWTWGTDASNNMTLQSGTGGVLTDVFHVSSSGHLTIPSILTAGSAGFSGTVQVAVLQNNSMITSCSGKPTGTFYNTTTSATGGGTIVAVCP